MTEQTFANNRKAEIETISAALVVAYIYDTQKPVLSLSFTTLADAIKTLTDLYGSILLIL